MSGSLALKYFLIVSLAIVFLSFEAFGQQGNITSQVIENEKKYVKNQVAIDFQYLGLGINYRRSINRKLSLGILGAAGRQREIRLFPEGNVFVPDDVFKEILHFGFAMQYVASKNIYLESGWRKIYYLDFDDSIISGDMINLTIFYDLNSVHLGSGLNYGKNEFRAQMAYSSLLTLRIPLKKL